MEDALAELKNLRLLKLRGKFQERLQNLRSPSKRRRQSKGNFKDFLLNLRWLSWQQCPSDFQSINFNPSNLVVLELCHSSVSENWKGWEQIMMAHKLKVLDLTGCKRLERTPDFSSFHDLERLILRNCDGLVEISPSLGKLGKLTYLNMEGCTSLVKFPASIEVLTNLRTLSLRCCKKFMELPLSIGYLKSLIELDISQTCITELPDSISNLQRLEVINMSRSHIRRIPAALSLLEGLEQLHAEHCSELKGEIPGEFGGLTSLKILNLHRSKIGVSPESINNLSNLEVLMFHLSDAYGYTDLRWIYAFYKLKRLVICSSHVKAVGDELASLTHLEQLELFCPNLEGGIKFPSTLRGLAIIDNSILYPPGRRPNYDPSRGSLTPYLGELQMLRTLTLSSYKISCLDGFHLSRNLRCLVICFYRGRIIPDLSNLKNLTTLNIFAFGGIVEIQGLGELKLLQNMRLVICYSSKALPGLSNLINLKVLHISHCKNLGEVRGLESLKSLLSLIIQYCDSLETLPDISLFYGQLVQLKIDCPKLPKAEEVRDQELADYFMGTAMPSYEDL